MLRVIEDISHKYKCLFCPRCSVTDLFLYNEKFLGWVHQSCGHFLEGTKEDKEMNEIKDKNKTIEFGSNCEICNGSCQKVCTCEKPEREKQDYDIVEKPYHYNVGIEVDKFIDSWDMNYRQGNIIKYVTRYPYKDPTKKVQDLKKAKWYLERLIEKEEEKEKNVPTK